MGWNNEKNKINKNNIEKIFHPISKIADKYFASNCSALCIIVQPVSPPVKSYYGY
jgi:hypothetical protein